MEIGSEFWFEDVDTDRKMNGEWIQRFGNTVFTSSGRGAISLLLQEVKPKIKTALLPSYICDSVISPFIKEGYDCLFYDIDTDLSPVLETIIETKNVGIFLHMGYYGFPTDKILFDIITELKNKDTIIVEDITHTLFSQYSRFEANEYYVASVRKWMGLPSGGLLASCNDKIKSPLQQNELFASIRKEALLLKTKYIFHGEVILKQEFQTLFAKGEALLAEDIAPWDIDELSKNIIDTIDVNKLINKRRKNFQILEKGMNDINFIKPVVTGMTDKICPMFYPVYIKNNRSEMKNRLSSKQIYCPVHWPMPKEINHDNLIKAPIIYDTILSIPCDQRFESNDMDRVVSAFRDFEIEEGNYERNGNSSTCR